MGRFRCKTSREAIEATFAGRWSLSDSNSWAALTYVVCGESKKRKQIEAFRLIKRDAGKFVFSGLTCNHEFRPSVKDLIRTFGGILYLFQGIFCL